MPSTCSRHGSTLTVGCEECVKALQQALQEIDQALQEKEQSLQEIEQALQRYAQEYPSMANVARSKIIGIRSETSSSAHTNTGHETADYQEMEIPKVTLGEEFWNTSTSCEFPEYVDSEPDVNYLLWKLLHDVVKALKMTQHINVNVSVPIMDTVSDLGITTKHNRILIGTVEVKKPARSENENQRIFGSGTAVAGEVFEQLYLCQIQNDTFSVGLLSTFNSFRLVSTKNLSKYELSLASALDSFNKAPAGQENTSTTPDNNEALVDPTGKSDASNAKRLRRSNKAEVEHSKASAKTIGTKKGRVSVQIIQNSAKREYYATKVVSFGENEQQNRGVIELLAAFILLCVEVQFLNPSQPLDLTKSNVKCLVRHLVAGTDMFAFTHICLPEGVSFYNLPLQNEKDYYVIRQLGYGNYGVSCFACTKSCAPCVIKYFRKQRDSQETFRDAAEETEEAKEAFWWHHLYGDLGFNKDVVKFYEAPRRFLVLPFLRIPCNVADRTKLVEGEKEDSLLYKALKHLESKNCIHQEVFWHHIGLVGKSAPTNDANSTDRGLNMSCPLGKKSKRGEEELQETAVFCDLAHVKKCEDKEELRKWVDDSFQRMIECIGKAANNQPQVVLKEQGKGIQ